jgi:uncharacterized alpha/beta hydrolase family protein
MIDIQGAIMKHIKLLMIIIILTCLIISDILIISLNSNQTSESQVNSDFFNNDEINIITGSRSTENSVKPLVNGMLSNDNSHGGSWLDSFEDDSNIDWTLSENMVYG